MRCATLSGELSYDRPSDRTLSPSCGDSKQHTHAYLWSSYNTEADTLYINFKKASVATDSELTDDDIIVRYEGDEVIGLTSLHASTR